MKKINDERIELQKLKNIRLAFIIQSAGIMAILIWRGITGGITALTTSPLWILLLLVLIILSYQNIKIADDVDDQTMNPGRYYRVIIFSGLLGVGTGLLDFFFPGEQQAKPFLVGGIVFVCFLIPFTIVYYLLKKRYEKSHE